MGGEGENTAVDLTAGDPADVENDNDRIITEEFKIWKKNTPFLYDIVMSHSLEWPSLTVQWLPDVSSLPDKDYETHKLILGTHTEQNEQNYLMIATVNLPKEDTEIDARKYDDERDEVGGFGGVDNKIEISVKLNHEGEVNRARYMPQNPFVIATKGPHADVCVFDVSRHPSVPANNTVRPEHRCTGHTKEGFGLAWNPHKEGGLLSGSEDMVVCYWDLKEAGKTVAATRQWKGHTAIVSDVAWHCSKPTLFGSVGDDKQLLIWDLDEAKDAPVFAVPNAHEREINCLAFAPHSEFLLATGSNDRTVALWDMRNLSQKLHSLEGHRGDVFQVQWCPLDETVLASCSSDRRVHVWDMARIGEEQDEEDREDGPPELLFIHGGHTARVEDFSWNPNMERTIASVSMDNVLQVWQVADNVFNEGNEDEEEPADDDLE
ncbi:WD40-repeat-containing domain protein [Tribonema minus]|uniref:WD40-repeat-containing domain protein n=1 Tax=Tribonema minus TaxID=303371 RepID=A0A835ZEH9_9STRA|nr:WD40-repeat-containing domain protein [Tribonema minus]